MSFHLNESLEGARLEGQFDYILMGTGVAPLVVASRLISEQKRVLILNPDSDFFLEDSEFGIDPLWPVSPEKDAAKLNVKRTPIRIQRSSPDSILEELRPGFPGAIEAWPSVSLKKGEFLDGEAPFVRNRSRLWITRNERDRDWPWELLEDLYVEASDAGLHPTILEGVQAESRFPGISKPGEESRGLLIPKVADVDVNRYRVGLLEYVRERLGSKQIVSSASQIEIIPGGVRYYSGKTLKTARANEGAFVFWTPRLSSWILGQAKKLEMPLPSFAMPTGVRLWEQWSILSRDPLDPSVVGVFRDMAVWAEVEGAPDRETQKSPEFLHKMSVLKAGELLSLENYRSGSLGSQGWMSKKSMGAVSELCHSFLKWEKFSIRSVKVRATLEWEQRKNWYLSQQSGLPILVVNPCDGPLFEVVRTSRMARDQLDLDRRQDRRKDG